MFVGEIKKFSNQQVATIGSKGNHCSVTGTVKCKWCDNSGKSNKYLVEVVLFFPQSPINILIVTCSAQQLNDLTSTGINTQQLQSLVFTWTQINSFLQSNIRHLTSQKFLSMKVLRCQQYIVCSY